jgi:hypothetical protein
VVGGRFAQRPSYDLTYRRFIELEQCCLDDFFDATIPLIRNAKRRSGELVGWDLHLDCTEAESHVRLHHDCREGEGCPGWDMPLSDRHHRAKDPKARKRAPAGQAKTAGKLSSAEAAASRRARSRAPLREDGTPDLCDDNIDNQYNDLDRDVLRLRVGGHWWTCRDKTAGARAHTGGRGAVKFWTGFYNAKLACHTFATSIVNLVEGADEYEPNLFEEMLLRAERILGEDHIRSVSADSGFADKRVHMTCAEHGVTAITPWKRTASEPEGLPPDREFVDRDGIPRCKHCGGETEFVRFSRWANDQSKNGQQRAKIQGKAKPERVLKPRLWFRCARPFPECRDKRGYARVQSLLVDREPRLLRPLWATTPAYQALRELGLSEERVHHVARARHANGAKDTSSRPQRIGRDWQQLRAHAATILDWLKINWIEGWLPNVEGCIARNPERPYRQNGDDLAAQMAAERRVEGLQRPYGPAAVKAGYGPVRPDRTKRAINPDTGEIVAEGLTGRELDALLKSMERGEHQLLVVEDDPNANAPPDAHPRPGEPPPRSQFERDLRDGRYGAPSD